MKNFFRKVAFGLKPEEKAPSDPLTWAQKQVETIPELNWKGKYIYSEKEMRKYWITQRVEENTTLRKKYKNDPKGLEIAERQLENDTGGKFWQNNEISIRHAEGVEAITLYLLNFGIFGAIISQLVKHKDCISIQLELIKENL